MRYCGDLATVYRVVIQKKGKVGVEWTETLGPYGTLGAAKGQLSHATNSEYREASGYIERSTTTWERVEL